MRKKNLFLSMLAALAFVGCSSENDVVTGGDTDSNKGTSYMAVNLVSSDVMGTRAAAGYEDGSDIENNVTSVRFYFFNGAGGAVNVKLLNGSYVNYYDWTPETGDQSEDTNGGDDIESKLTATIVINTAEGDKIPQRIAAVLNPPTINGNPLLGNASMGLSDLKEKVADFAASGLTTKGNFVMFNSVGGGGKSLSTTLIEDKNLCKSEAAALKAPVTIYVERSVAKVRVTLGNAVSDAGTTTGLALKDKDGKNILVDGQQVYLKLDGWGLTAETDNGRLIKKVNPAWEDAWYTNYRSFWAINSMSAQNKYTDYTSIDTPFGIGNALYTNENAQLTDVGGAEGNAKARTKVIFKGTLCKADGTALTIVRHLGAYFADTESETESANLPKLKESILNLLAASGKNYYFAKDGGREQIGTGDLQIVIASQQAQEGSKNNCYVYAQLTDAAAAKTWYSSMDQSAQPITGAADEINGVLANAGVIDRALVWNSGMTYYYHEIEHEYGETKQPGVVRNHIYAVNVTAITGLGTPVYDPDQIIYPEIPESNSHYIAAQINILSWRLVKNDVQLGY